MCVLTVARNREQAQEQMSIDYKHENIFENAREQVLVMTSPPAAQTKMNAWRASLCQAEKTRQTCRSPIVLALLVGPFMKLGFQKSACVFLKLFERESKQGGRKNPKQAPCYQRRVRCRA